VPKIDAELVMLGGQGTGVAQLAGRVALEGTATRTSKQLKEELRSIGGAMSANVDHDATSISASSLSEFSPRLLELLSDVARNASYPKNEVDLAKTNFASEIEEERASPTSSPPSRWPKPSSARIRTASPCPTRRRSARSRASSSSSSPRRTTCRTTATSSSSATSSRPR